MVQLTLSFFDTIRGIAISDIDVEFQKIHDGKWQVLAQMTTDSDGNVSLTEDDFGEDVTGYYEATARVGSYFLGAGYVLPTLKFIDVVPLRFGLSDSDASTRINISVTPYGYSFQSC